MLAAALVLADLRETRGPGEGGRQTQVSDQQRSTFSSMAASGEVTGTEVGTDQSGIMDPGHHERSSTCC